MNQVMNLIKNTCLTRTLESRFLQGGEQWSKAALRYVNITQIRIEPGNLAPMCGLGMAFLACQTWCTVASNDIPKFNGVRRVRMR